MADTADGHKIGGREVAVVANYVGTNVENEANARLIAAAPELAGLLTEIRLAYEAMDQWRLRDTLAKVPILLEKAGVSLDAIAKAEGRTP